MAKNVQVSQITSAFFLQTSFRFFLRIIKDPLKAGRAFLNIVHNQISKNCRRFPRKFQTSFMAYSAINPKDKVIHKYGGKRASSLKIFRLSTLHSLFRRRIKFEMACGHNVRNIKIKIQNLREETDGRSMGICLLSLPTKLCGYLRPGIGSITDNYSMLSYFNHCKPKLILSQTKDSTTVHRRYPLHSKHSQNLLTDGMYFLTAEDEGLSFSENLQHSLSDLRRLASDKTCE